MDTAAATVPWDELFPAVLIAILVLDVIAALCCDVGESH
jgi:hypothetical protein